MSVTDGTHLCMVSVARMNSGFLGMGMGHVPGIYSLSHNPQRNIYGVGTVIPTLAEETEVREVK